MDAFYTPESLARTLVEKPAQSGVGYVFDPSVGEGSLLRAARKRWPEARLLGSDIDRSAIRNLQAEFPEWRLSVADYLNPRSWSSSAISKEHTSHGLDLVLLNPPFSYRGGAGIAFSSVWYSGRLPAPLYFLAKSIELRPRGGVHAILPSGVISGDKFKDFWKAVSLSNDVVVEKLTSTSMFSGARVRVGLVSISPRANAPLLITPSQLVPSKQFGKSELGCRCVDVLRGKIGLHRFAQLRIGAPFVHTSDFVDVGGGRRVLRNADPKYATQGAALLLARVGRPALPVVQIAAAEYVLSDCVVALRPGANSMLSALEVLVTEAMETLYDGTGAKYTTVARIVALLESEGWFAASSDVTSSRTRCRCGYVGKLDVDTLNSSDLRSIK